jgi:hypothetical protein
MKESGCASVVVETLPDAFLNTTPAAVVQILRCVRLQVALGRKPRPLPRLLIEHLRCFGIEDYVGRPSTGGFATVALPIHPRIETALIESPCATPGSCYLILGHRWPDPRPVDIECPRAVLKDVRRDCSL